jgi:phosphoribosylformylglycinamidine cyclo-ligase
MYRNDFEKILPETTPDGYLTKLSDGRSYGEALLDPTSIYVGLVEDCLDVGVDIHYAVNITGHGWRKLMRALQPFTYMIDTLPTQLPIFDFIQMCGPVDDQEAYGNLNMGAGFALYVDESDVEKVLSVSKLLGLKALAAGHIENGDKKVVIKPKGLEYAGEKLAIR